MKNLGRIKAARIKDTLFEMDFCKNRCSKETGIKWLELSAYERRKRIKSYNEKYKIEGIDNIDIYNELFPEIEITKEF